MMQKVRVERRPAAGAHLADRHYDAHRLCHFPDPLFGTGVRMRSVFQWHRLPAQIVLMTRHSLLITIKR